MNRNYGKIKKLHIARKMHSSNRMNETMKKSAIARH